MIIIKYIITVRNARKSNLELKHGSERIKTAEYNSAFAKLTAVVCFLPTEDSKDNEKIYFYERSHSLVS